MNILFLFVSESTDGEEEVAEGDRRRVVDDEEGDEDLEDRMEDAAEDAAEIEEERESGDGEEREELDPPDADEDRKNPAFVPKRGIFYQHDLRILAEGYGSFPLHFISPPPPHLYIHIIGFQGRSERGGREDGEEGKERRLQQVETRPLRRQGAGTQVPGRTRLQVRIRYSSGTRRTIWRRQK